MTTLRPTPSLKLNLVTDTGFLIAGALNNGYASNFLFDQSEVHPLQYSLFTSSSILNELQDKLENKFQMERAIVLKYLTDLQKVMLVVQPREKVKIVRDPDDNKILECALEAEADVVVSADKDLLVLKEFRGVKIIHPSQLKYLFTTESN